MTHHDRDGGPRLHQQVVLAAIVPLLLFGLVAVLVSATGLERTSLDLVLGRNAALARVQAAEVAAELNGRQSVLSTVAGELAAVADAPALLEPLLRERAPFLAAFGGGVAFLDTTGVAIATTADHAERKGYDYGFRSYFVDAIQQGQPVFSHVLSEEPSGRDAVVLAIPASREDMQVGVLIGVLFLEDEPWAGRLANLHTEPRSQAYLIDDTGVVIYHPDRGRIGSSISADAALQELLRDPEPHSALQISSFLGERVVASYAPLPGIGWGLIVEEPWQTIAAPAQPYRWGVAGLLLLGILISLALVVFAVYQVVRPLRALAVEATQVSAGAPFRPLAVEGAAELRRLIAVFNQMVSRLEEQQTSIRQYTLRVLHSQEEERTRISRDLHDETVQDLIALIMRIEFCRNAFRDDPSELEGLLDELEALARTALSHVRRISEGLRPHMLEDLGLPAVLRAQCRALEKDIDVERAHCEIVGDERRLPPEVELTIFRVVQEALTNIRRHAPGVRRVNVTLYYEAWGMLVTVEDDGPGFDVPPMKELAAQGHLGLVGMLERVRLVGGAIEIDSQRGRGVCVTLRIPEGDLRVAPTE